MNRENYIELYEAVYLFNRACCFADNKLPEPINQKAAERLGLNESIYRAIARILVVNKLLDYDGHGFVLTPEQKEKQRHILDNIIGEKDEHYAEMFKQSIDEAQFLFTGMSEAEYEIYARYNFDITFKIGKKIAEYVNLSNRKVLELGGNSGGLGTALVTKNKDCHYTIVDTKIPCLVGTELKESTGLSISFIEGDVFELRLPDGPYDYIILMNLLHDFDDIKCLDILRNCKKYCSSKTKFLIIEDSLTGEFEPKEAVMHGLRLSVYCRGGKQRTTEELTGLFSRINYMLAQRIQLDNVHTMLVMEAL